MAWNPQKELNILVRAYRSATLEIVSNIERMTRRGNSTRHARAALNETKKVLGELDEFADEWIEHNIPAAYRQGWDDAFNTSIYTRPRGTGGEIKYSDFAKINRQAVEVVAYNLRDGLHGATQKVGRQADDIFRHTGLHMTQQRLITGEAVAQTTAQMKERLVSQGVTAFEDKAGRTWNLDTYCEMVARTTTREATTLGTMNRALAGGYDLLVISEHHPTCHLCVVPETVVSGPVARAGIRREYSGDIVNIRTAAGNDLSGTPDHSVLTVNGWRRLQELRPGDKVLANNRREGESILVTGISPNKIQMPTAIENVFKSLRPPFGVNIFMCPARGNFDGNITDSQIDIVMPYSSLKSKWYTMLSEPFNNLSFIGRPGFGVSFSSESNFLFSLLAMSASTPGPISGFGLLCSLFWRHVFKLSFSSLGAHIPKFFGVHIIEGGKKMNSWRPSGDFEANQATSNSFMANSKYFSYFNSGFTRFIEANGLLGLLFAQGAEELSFSADMDSVFKQNIFSPAIADSKDGSYLIKGLSGLVTPDEILDVSIRHYSGHVYDLQTLPNWYIANNIVSHNCAPIQGKVFSITGNTPGYPAWDNYIPRHPHCLHTVSVYQPGYDSRADWRQEYSNTSLTRDPRSEAEKAAYKALQDGKRKQRDLRNQYQRYRARLGDEAGRIQDFAKARKIGGEKWEQLQRGFRDEGGLIRAEIESYRGNFILTPEGDRIELKPVPTRQIKTRAFMEESLKRAESTGADFTNVKIINVEAIDKNSAGTNAFIMINDPEDRIFLLATDIQDQAAKAKTQLKSLYQHYGLTDKLNTLHRLDQLEEATKRTLLHELGHIKTKHVTGNYLTYSPSKWLDQGFGEYIEEVIQLSGPIDNRVLGEWIAEDYRLLHDLESPYPHTYAYSFDLQNPIAAGARRKLLRRLLR